MISLNAAISPIQYPSSLLCSFNSSDQELTPKHLPAIVSSHVCISASLGKLAKFTNNQLGKSSWKLLTWPSLHHTSWCWQKAMQHNFLCTNHPLANHGDVPQYNVLKAWACNAMCPHSDLIQRITGHRIVKSINSIVTAYLIVPWYVCSCSHETILVRQIHVSHSLMSNSLAGSCLQN